MGSIGVNVERWPQVSCVVPVLDDASALPRAVSSILLQEYPGELTVVLAVGPSSDDSERVAEELASSDDRIQVVANPTGGTAAALNAAIAAAPGEVIARVDARSVVGTDYLRTAVELLHSTGADNVGGMQIAEGETTFQRAVATAMSSPFGAGDARFRIGGEPGPTDSVYLGVFRRAALERIGGFDETLVRNQDYELNIRLRETGGIVYFDPRLRVTYTPRSSLRSLARQYYQYGMWKQVVVRRHPRSLRSRQALPPLAVAAHAAAILLALAGRRRALAAPLVYLAATLAAAAVAGKGQPWPVVARLPLVFATMHHCWGVGFLVSGIVSLRPRDRAPTVPG